MYYQGTIVKRVLTAMLAAAAALAFMPAGGLTQNVYAAENAGAIQDGAGSIKGYDKKSKTFNYVYYGSFDLTKDSVDNPTPIKWRVLSMNGSGGTYSGGADSSKAMFLLSEDLLTNDLEFNGWTANTGQKTANAWQHSVAQGWCTDFYKADLSSLEQKAVLATSKTGDTFKLTHVSFDEILSNDKVFLLSADEAASSSYGFADDNSRTARYNGRQISWWLRSQALPGDTYAGDVSGAGKMDFCLVTFTTGARPAFNLDQGSVLFSSAATDGKLSGSLGASALEAVKDYSGSEWKLTLSDADRHFDIREISESGSTMTVDYTGAAVGNNEYISAVIRDGSGKITYYGRLAQPKAAAGKVDVALPDGFDDSADKLYLFSEQYNGDKKTDYASELKLVKMKDASVSPSAEVFDKYAPSDIKVTRSDGIHSLTALKNGAQTLVQGKDYTISGSTVIIGRSYLAALANGQQTLTFDYSGGIDPTVVIDIKDSRPAAAAPTITAQPTGGSYDTNGSITPLTVSVSDKGAKFQWQKSTDGKTWTNIAGAVSSSYMPSADVSGSVRYRCVVTGSNGASVYSRAVTVTVKTKPQDNRYAVGTKVTNGILVYKVTKQPAAGAAGTVQVVKAVKKSYKSITVPSSVTLKGYKYNVTSIGSKAFYKNTKLKKLTVGRNVTVIGSKAAYRCKNLKTVNIKSKKVTRIGKAAFKKCKKGIKFRSPKSKYKAYKKMLKKSRVPKKTRYVKS